MKHIIETKPHFFCYNFANEPQAGCSVGTSVWLKVSSLFSSSFQLERESDHTRLNSIWKKTSAKDGAVAVAGWGENGGSVSIFLVGPRARVIFIPDETSAAFHQTVSQSLSSKPAPYHENPSRITHTCSQSVLLMLLECFQSLHNVPAKGSSRC